MFIRATTVERRLGAAAVALPEKVYRTVIPRNVRLAEAPSMGCR